MKRFVGGVFGGAAIACIAWLAACGSDTTATPPADGGISDATAKDHAAPPAADTGASAATCPGAVDTSMIPTWKAPKSGVGGSCSASDITAFDAAANKTGATFTDLFNSITASPACQACIFSTEMDANWQPIVWSPDQASGTAFVNFGACYAAAPGGTAACGKGVQDDEFCILAACPTATCTDQTGCVNAAEMDQCKTQNAEVTTGCGSALTKLNTACGKFLDGLKTVCAGAAGDGGTDGGDDGSADAGDDAADGM
jgi:hypothetical protein